ncbi:MAG: undecaprenyl-diphosphatase UppP [Deltaproteobacteria bacterium]|nr:undecaprenyl-diphosphatase UppP [Deltaproteobacteria bacterium]
MQIWEAILLGIVQGLGEFLPISSSAHLFMFNKWFQLDSPGLAFDIALHLGTLFSLLAFFYQDWIKLTRAFFTSLKKIPQKQQNPLNSYERLIWLIILGTIPVVVFALSFEDYIENQWRQAWIVGINMALFGVLLWWADRKSKKLRNMDTLTWKDSFWIGIAQCLALIPGSSRSGVTITGGLLRNLDRDTAARFSFLLSTPAVLGAAILKLPKFFNESFNLTVLIGILTSAIVGFLAIKYMLYFLKKYSFSVYVVYRLIFAAFVFIALYLKS